MVTSGKTTRFLYKKMLMYKKLNYQLANKMKNSNTAGAEGKAPGYQNSKGDFDGV